LTVNDIIVAPPTDVADSHLIARFATYADAPAIATIYNEGIEDGIATFETRPRTAEEVTKWFGPRFPIVVVENEEGHVIAFASTSEYRPRDCYAGIAEFSVYVARTERGHGAGRLAMQELMAAARNGGFWKLISRVFPENIASRALLKRLGFREVGIYQRHAQSHGVWRDVVIVEALLTES
jgi:phosphinothricin acetyltransferase